MPNQNRAIFYLLKQDISRSIGDTEAVPRRNVFKV